jgi:hypothetical protein
MDYQYGMAFSGEVELKHHERGHIDVQKMKNTEERCYEI